MLLLSRWASFKLEAAATLLKSSKISERHFDFKAVDPQTMQSNKYFVDWRLVYPLSNQRSALHFMQPLKSLHCLVFYWKPLKDNKNVRLGLLKVQSALSRSGPKTYVLFAIKILL